MNILAEREMLSRSADMDGLEDWDGRTRQIRWGKGKRRDGFSGTFHPAVQLLNTSNASHDGCFVDWPAT